MSLDYTSILFSSFQSPQIEENNNDTQKQEVQVLYKQVNCKAKPTAFTFLV